MHVLHTLFTHTAGGLGQAHLNTTEALASKGHVVTCLMHPGSPYCAQAAAYGAVLKIRPRGFYDIFALWKIRRLLKQLRPDIILAHNARAIALMKAAAWRLGILVCGATHSYKTPRTLRADALVVLSAHMAEHFRQAGYSRRIEIIPNLIHLPPKPDFREPRTPPVIAALGRFTVEKGFADFIEALHVLKQSGFHFLALIGGDGPEFGSLKAQAEKLGVNVEWDGWVADKAAFYRRADILGLPSREESFPLVVIEALAHGVPIVATDAPGPASMLTHGVNGLLVPRADARAMAEALEKAASQPGLALQLAAAGWERVQEYDFSAVAKRWDEALSAIATAPQILPAPSSRA